MNDTRFASDLRLVERGTVRSERLDPADLGLATAPISALAGGDVETNRTILAAVLRGEGAPAQRDVVALNTALVLWAAGLIESVAAGLPAARAALADGAAWDRVKALRQALPLQPGS